MSEELKTPLRDRIGYQAGLLGGFASLAAVFLVSGNMLTTQPIAERQREDLLDSLSQVMPSELYDNDVLAKPLNIETDNQNLTVYRGTFDNRISALAWEISEQGYAGEIRLIMGVKPSGEILGVRVLSHAETPGLGDKIEPAKDDWILGFNGLSLGNPVDTLWGVKKDGGQFDAFSGATITPRAVVKAIKDGLAFFEQNKSDLINLDGSDRDAILMKQATTTDAGNSANE
jgi:electron transport complex protein RnfG